MLAHSFLIKSSSKLLVTRTGIKAQMSSISGLWFPWPIYMFFEMRFDLGTLDSDERSLPFGLLVLELLALEWWKFHTIELEYLWSQLANLDQILFVASLGRGKGCIRFWGRLDQNTGFHGNRKPPLTYNGENDVSTFSRLFWSNPFEKTTFDLGTLDSGERSLPFGLLVFYFIEI